MVESILDDIINDAHSCYPCECCGLVIEQNKHKLAYIPCKNIIPKNENEQLRSKYNFAIDPIEYAET